MYAMATIGAFFLRETKTEQALKNLYSEIIYEGSMSNLDDLISKRKRRTGDDIPSPDNKDGPDTDRGNNQQNVLFNHLLNEMSELGKEDNSKFGTLAGNPKDFRLKIESDFNAD